MLARLAEGSPEQQAIDAGEIDAVIDYASANVILLPAARRALEAASAGFIANRLLAALPPADYQRLLSRLEPLTVRFGEALHEPGAPIAHVYFPTDCLVSLQAAADADRGLEVGLVGYEGMVGLPLVLGMESSPVRALVQASGTALRMKAAGFREAMRQCLPLQRGMLRHAHAELAMARQTAACNFYHAVEARLARRLLMTSDRLRSPQFVLTQALLAKTLGLRRATINEAAGPLQQRGLISYVRGDIRILDRSGLKAVSCRCYTSLEGAA